MKPGRRPLQGRLPSPTRGSVVLTDPVYSEFESTAIRELIRRQSITAVAVGYLSPRVFVRSVQLAYVSCTFASLCRPIARSKESPRCRQTPSPVAGRSRAPLFEEGARQQNSYRWVRLVRPVSWPAPTSRGARLTDSLGSARAPPRGRRCDESYLVDPASSHMLVSKIKPCMSKCKLLYCETANGSLNQLSSI